MIAGSDAEIFNTVLNYSTLTQKKSAFNKTGNQQHKNKIFSDFKILSSNNRQIA